MTGREIVDFALDEDTDRLMAEQRAWIASEPGNPRPYYHLGMFYRMRNQRDEGLALLLHAVALDPTFAPAHAALSETYAALNDIAAARRHALRAEELGEPRAADQLRRYGALT